MAAAKPTIASLSPERAPRQIKSKHKSRSGCQACKLRRLKCDETKPSCRNCQKKGQECPGYTLRLQWSTKYERPRDPARGEPTNFDQLVSAVTRSIVPGAQAASPAPEARPLLKSETSASSCESLATSETASRISEPSPALTPIEPSGSSQLIPRSVTSAPPMAFPFMPAQLDSGSLTLLADARHPDYSSSVDLTNANGFIEFDSGSMLDSASVSGDSFWGSSRNDSPAPGVLDNIVALVTSQDVDEPETSLLRQTEAGVNVRPARPVVPFRQIISQTPQLTKPLVDIPTFLIQHWFKSVCGSWSAFDSQSNPYRTLSASLWQSSMAVFYALQSMAAASLVEHLPHLKEVSRFAPRLALQAINYELQNFMAVSKSAVTFPGGLVLSLFCMSSSNCWTDSRQFGLQFLKPSRWVLNCLNRVASFLDPQDRALLNFFNGCLIYEEMLRSIVSNDESDMENLASWPVSPTQPISVSPHAWTGVSPDLLRLFGKIMFLCRRSRNRWRQPDTVADKILHETADYQEATVIEEVLLGIDLTGVPLVEGATEEAALKRHLHDAAEAYRLSSLLQLYQTFPSLIARRLPGQVDANGFVPFSGWLSPLALHITNILRSIPPSSNMRCLQPLLCLCAGTGLRYDHVDPLMRGENHPFQTASIPGLGFEPLGSAASTVYGLSGLSSSVIGENDLEIASARRFLMERLSRLEQNLPPKPIQVEKELLKSIWATYDAEREGTCTTHWLDVMVNNELESVFG